MNQLSRFVSVVFHPLMMPFLATCILFNSGNYLSYTVSGGLQRFLYIIIFLCTFLLPATIAWMMHQRGWIRSMEMEDRSERHIPFLMTFTCYLGGVYLLNQLPVSRLFSLMLTGATLAILLGFLINLRWKISIHMIGVGGIMGLFYGFGRFFHLSSANTLIGLAVLAGIIGTARLQSRAHNPAQVYAGFLTGFLAEAGFISLVAFRLIGL